MEGGFEMKEKIYNLFHCGYLEVREWLKETDIVIIPLGSMEQHGRHCPVCTDSIATELPCQIAAEMANVPYMPLIPIGYSPQHLHPPGIGSGTVTFTATTYQNMLYEIGRCLIHNGFNKLVFATGHTSNMKAVDPALRALRYETNCFVCCYRNDAEAVPALLADQGIIENPPLERSRGLRVFVFREVIWEKARSFGTDTEGIYASAEMDLGGEQ
jgi:creatinine amidohydrolase